MTNNDILRRLRYAFKLNDTEMISIFKNTNTEISKEQLLLWLKKEDDEGYERLIDRDLATFLNGFIILKRGPKEGSQPIPEDKLNNNIILRKLKIALNLKDFEMLEILDLADFRLGKAELSAFFRKPEHQHYRKCKDQILRNFIQGLTIKNKKK